MRHYTMVTLYNETLYSETLYETLYSETLYSETLYNETLYSETLYNDVELRIGDICLYMCVDVRMPFCTSTLVYFCVSSVFDPVPNFTEQNPQVL